MLFSPSVAGLLAGRGVMIPMGMTSNAASNVTVALTVYSGTQPSANTISSNWTNYNTTYLFHMANVEYELVYSSSNTLSGLISNANFPTSNAAVSGGTAGWCIIWCSNVQNGNGAGQIANTTIPNAQFLVGPVTEAWGNGVVRLTNTSISSAQTYNFVDSTIYFSV